MRAVGRGAEPGAGPVLGRRGFGFAAAAITLTAAAPALAAQAWHNVDVMGVSAPLAFSMTRASDGKDVTAADYRGKVVLLYFGYTFCPDVCPTTLGNVSQVLKQLGKQADHVRMLFVTVDPDRDTLPVLKQYIAAFPKQFDALRGTPDALASLARRFRIAYSVTPASKGQPYEVTHSSAIYTFDATGAARLLIPSMSSQTPDIAGTAEDLRRLISGAARRSLWSRLLGWV